MDECSFSTVYNKKALQNYHTKCQCEETAISPRKPHTGGTFKYKDDVMVTSPNFELSQWIHTDRPQIIRSIAKCKPRSRQESRQTKINEKFKSCSNHKTFMEEYRTQHAKTLLNGSSGKTEGEVTLGVNVPDPYVFKTEYFRVLCNQVLSELHNSNRDNTSRRLSFPVSNKTSRSQADQLLLPSAMHGLRNNVSSPQIQAIEQLCANMELLAKGLFKEELPNQYTRRVLKREDTSLPHLTSKSAETFKNSLVVERDRLSTSKSAPASLSSARIASTKNYTRTRCTVNDKKKHVLYESRRIRKKKIESEINLVNRPVTCGYEIMNERAEENRLKHIQLTGKSARKRKKISLKL